jgi:hypothetical protein
MRYRTKAEQAWVDYIEVIKQQYGSGEYIYSSVNFEEFMKKHHEELSLQDFEAWFGTPGEIKANDKDWKTVLEIKRNALLKIWTEE